MKFEITGNFRIGEEYRKFKKEVSAKDEAGAKERTYTLLGSEHGCKRRWIDILEVKKAA
ncbi:MAG: 50S ribosomal protein L18a [Candidatus Altiarchaeota archaeon]|nr:50S ribosomal protein L18a [Candidatus Altiarchaeota archaeon]